MHYPTSQKKRKERVSQNILSHTYIKVINFRKFNNKPLSCLLLTDSINKCWTLLTPQPSKFGEWVLFHHISKLWLVSRSAIRSNLMISQFSALKPHKAMLIACWSWISSLIPNSFYASIVVCAFARLERKDETHLLYKHRDRPFTGQTGKTYYVNGCYHSESFSNEI